MPIPDARRTPVVTRETTWRALCIQADPEFTKSSRQIVEYECSSGGRRNGDERVFRNGYRVFMGDYQVRGPYRPEEVPEDALTWNGVPITFNGDFLTFTPSDE